MTVYASELARGLAGRGHDVTVSTTRHPPEASARESLEGVEVVRARVLATLHKGVLSPAFIARSIALARAADVVNLHLPMIEGSAVAWAAAARKLVVTYHCDVTLEGPGRLFVQKPLYASHRLTFARAPRVVVNTLDYARRSRFLAPYLAKLVEAAPLGRPRPPGRPTYRRSGRARTVGFLGRIVEEKGLRYLLEAVAALEAAAGPVEVLVGGPSEGVAGGSVIGELRPLIEAAGEAVRMLGPIPEERMGDFLASLDCFALPSVNPFESFGLVQLEAMMAGVPVVASDLPGVRTVVGRTGMGLVARRRDPADLAEKIAAVLADPGAFVRTRAEIEGVFSADRTLDVYEGLFRAIARNR
jgi:glycosyltransferase involved in cell wall biosynthesis